MTKKLPILFFVLNTFLFKPNAIQAQSHTLSEKYLIGKWKKASIDNDSIPSFEFIQPDSAKIITKGGTICGKFKITKRSLIINNGTHSFYVLDILSLSKDTIIFKGILPNKSKIVYVKYS